MGNQMSLEENENDESEHNEMKVIEKNDSECIESNQDQSENGGSSGNVNKKIKRNTQYKSDLVKKRRSTSKSGANSNTFKKTRHNRRR